MPPAAKNLPAGLRGPVEVMLSRSAEGIPATTAMSGGTRYQPKFDGWRAVLVRNTAGVRLWSRQRVDLSDVSTGVACPYAVETGVIGNALVHDRCRARGRAKPDLAFVMTGRIPAVVALG